MRQQTLLIRIGDEDRAALDAAAKAFGVSRAAIIRRALGALRGRGIAGDLDSGIALKVLQASLLATGRNLNQIARSLNEAARGSPEHEPSITEIVGALDDFRRALIGAQLAGEVDA